MQPDKRDEFYSIHVPEAKNGDHYRFYIKFQDLAPGWYSDPRSIILHQCETFHCYNSVVYDDSLFVWTDEAFAIPEKSALVLYQLHIASFGSNDGEVYGNTGTFLSCIDRLDHLVKLGINCIALLPISKDACPHVCWGYDPISLFAIQDTFGTPDDLKQFVNECHIRNIAVLLDWVPNHLSDKNIVENWGCYIYPDDRSFTDFGPKPDYRSPQVRAWLLDNLQQFLLMFHFDGVRVDSTGTMRQDSNGQEMFEAWTLMQNATAIIRDMKPKAIIIAEDLKHNPALHYVAGFDAQWEDTFFRHMLDVVSTQDDNGIDLGKLKEALHGPPFLADLDLMHRVIFTENHDTIPINRCNRFPVAIATKGNGSGEDGDSTNAEHNVVSLKRSTLAAAILFCTPGIPMILAGQELYEIYGSEWPIPPPIDWSRKQTYAGICQLYADLIELRKNSGRATAGLTSPNFRIYHENHFEKVLAFHRYLRFGPSDDTIVVVNASSNEKPGYRLGIPRPGRWFKRCNTDDQKYYAKFDGSLKEEFFDIVDFPNNEPYDGFPFSIWFSHLPRYSVIILSQ